MKKIFILLFLISTNAYSQEWVKQMNDPDVNFYTAQESFNKYYKEHLKKENSFFKKLFRWTREAEKETPGLEVFRRWENFMTPRVYPTGNRIQPDHLWKEFYRWRRGSGQPNLQLSGNWTSLGPNSWITNSYNPGIGRVNVVAVDPVNSSIIYIGSPSGGLWKSIDGGSTWMQPTTDKLPSIGVSSIVIDYSNTNTIYIGTGDADATDTYSNGVLKSTDGGLTWLPTGLSFSLIQTRRVGKMLMDPLNPQMIYAATSTGLFKTVDGGTSWTNIRPGNFRDIEFKPGNSQVIYACGNSFEKTEDGGQTFTVITSGLAPSGDINRLAVAVTPADSNYVYVAAGDNNTSGFYGIYRSTDGGNTFTQRANSPNLYGYDTNGSDVGGQSWFTMTLSISPFNKNVVYTGGVNIWYSDDGGATWTINTHWYYGGSFSYVHADQHHMDFVGSTLFVGCDGGIFKSDDFGSTWTDLSAGLTISQLYRIGGSEVNPAIIMGGAQDNGCNLLNNGQWTHVLGADGMEVAISPVNQQVIFAESQNGGINRSTNGGLTMSNISTSITNVENGAWVTPFVIDPLSPTTLYAGYENVWASLTNGSTWSKISNFNTGSFVTAIAVAPANPDFIYIVKGTSLFKTDNGGATWTNISAGLPTAGAAATYIAVHDVDPSKLWVTFSGIVSGSKVFYSDNAGLTWINESLNLPNVPVNCIAYENSSAGGLYIGTDLGVFYKNDSLIGWLPFMNNLPNVSVSELEINYASGKIRAGTYGRGIWESDLYQLSLPQADFTSDKQHICPGGTVNFTDMSVEAYPGWQWSFPGGNPSSSTQQNPSVMYSAAGNYDVQLIVQNPAGSDTLLRTLYIDVSSPLSTTLPLMEGFENAQFPPALWSITDPDGIITWQEASVGAFGNSAKCAMVPNFGQSLSGEKDWLLTPLIDLSQLSAPAIKFDRAYARIPARLDSLRIFYTSDCGVTRTYVYSKAATALANAGVLTTAFTPTASQWVSDSVTLPASAGIVQIGFENRNGYGNNLYIDNINIYDNVVGIDENIGDVDVSFSPNPAADQVIFIVNSNNPSSFPYQLKIRDAIGRIIATHTFDSNGNIVINTSKWQSGFYLIEGLTSKGSSNYSRKLQVVH
jgi:PKD repeat protein